MFCTGSYIYHLIRGCCFFFNWDSQNVNKGQERIFVIFKFWVFVEVLWELLLPAYNQLESHKKILSIFGPLMPLCKYCIFIIFLLLDNKLCLWCWAEICWREWRGWYRGCRIYCICFAPTPQWYYSRYRNLLYLLCPNSSVVLLKV